jgi:hypothetical protein
MGRLADAVKVRPGLEISVCSEDSDRGSRSEDVKHDLRVHVSLRNEHVQVEEGHCSPDSAILHPLCVD